MFTFPTPLIGGKLIQRYKRFLADIQLDSGEIITAHCPNTGAMTTCANLNTRVYVSISDNPKRKLKYTWELSSDKNGHLICVNTTIANKLIKNVLSDKQLTEIRAYNYIKPEFTFMDSRIDFALGNVAEDNFLPNNKFPDKKGAKLHSLIEVKSVTLATDLGVSFPDAITSRGAKHCRTLVEATRQDIDAYLLYCIMRNGKDRFSLAADIDEKYVSAVKMAMNNNVKIILLFTDISMTDIKVSNYILIE